MRSDGVFLSSIPNRSCASKEISHGITNLQVAIFRNALLSPLFANGLFPVSRIYMIQPRDQISEEKP